MSWTTNDLLASIRRRGSIPTTTNSSNVNSTQSLLDLATEELHNSLLPMLMSTREEWYVNSQEQAIVANQAAYIIPTRASGVVLRDIKIRSDNSLRSLPPIAREHVDTTGTGSVDFYYIQHNKVILHRTPSVTQDTLVLDYFLRPSRLAATTACAQITDITDLTVTVGAIPSIWTTGSKIDFISQYSPFAPHAIDQTIATLSGTVFTFAALPAGLVVGDWIALADYTPIPQIPQEFQSVLAQLVVVRALEALGDREGSKQAFANYQALRDNALMLITPRNQGERKTVGSAWRRSNKRF